MFTAGPNGHSVGKDLSGMGNGPTHGAHPFRLLGILFVIDSSQIIKGFLALQVNNTIADQIFIIITISVHFSECL